MNKDKYASITGKELSENKDWDLIFTAIENQAKSILNLNELPNQPEIWLFIADLFDLYLESSEEAVASKSVEGFSISYKNDYQGYNSFLRKWAWLVNKHNKTGALSLNQIRTGKSWGDHYGNF